MDATGAPDGEPTRAGVAITDYLAGLYAVQGILLALQDRHRTRPRPARRHRALRLDPLGDAAAARHPARDRHRAAAGRATTTRRLRLTRRSTRRKGRSSSPSAIRGCGSSSATAIERHDLMADLAVCHQRRSAGEPRGAQGRASKRCSIASPFRQLIDRLERTRCPAAACGRSPTPSPTRRSSARDMLVTLHDDELGAGRRTWERRSSCRAHQPNCASPPPRLGEHTDEVLAISTANRRASSAGVTGARARAERSRLEENAMTTHEMAIAHGRLGRDGRRRRRRLEPRRCQAEQPREAARTPITKHTYPLDDAHYLRWALPPGEEAYGRIDGERLKKLGRPDHRRVAQEPRRRRALLGPHRRHQVRRDDRADCRGRVQVRSACRTCGGSGSICRRSASPRRGA